MKIYYQGHEVAIIIIIIIACLWILNLSIRNKWRLSKCEKEGYKVVVKINTKINMMGILVIIIISMLQLIMFIMITKLIKVITLILMTMLMLMLMVIVMATIDQVWSRKIKIIMAVKIKFIKNLVILLKREVDLMQDVFIFLFIFFLSLLLNNYQCIELRTTFNLCKFN